ncbi:MAG: AAA family ATPase [Oscillospiraceae bacterium]|nr:AAA family ATPase [Oscillospiraceae bacterium]
MYTKDDFPERFIRAVRLNSREGLGYAADIPVIRHLSRLEFSENVTFLVGENGSGKSTLLEGIAVAAGFNPEGGTLNFSFSTNDTHSGLYRALTLERGIRRPKDGYFLRAESFYNAATYLENVDDVPWLPSVFESYGGKSLHAQSHGESFMALCLNRFGGKGLYLLDEPEAALSPQNQLALLSRIHSLAADGSQFIIATHSPILMACPDAVIYVIDEDGIRETPYRETAHVQLTRSFLENPERMLRYLLEE